MLASARARGAPGAFVSARVFLAALAALAAAGCEDLRVAAGARDLLAHYQRCKLVEEGGALARDGEGRIDAPRPGRGTVRCRQGKELVTLRLTAVEPARLELHGPQRLRTGEEGTYHLSAFDGEGRALRVGRVAWELGAGLEAVPRCPQDLPSCPDFLDSILVRLGDGAREAALRACLGRCATLAIRRR